MDDSFEFTQLKLFTANESDLKDAARDMRVWGCCSRCILRYLGEEQVEHFRNLDVLEKWLTEWLGKDGQQVETAEVCIVCLGVLQTKYCDSTFLDEVVGIVKKEDYEISSFTPALSFTVIVMLREHSLWIALKENHKNVYFGKGPEEVLGTKEIWKELNGPYLAEKFGMPMEIKNAGKLEIKMSFQHPSTNSECSFLLDAFPELFRKRKSKNARRGLDIFSRINVAKALNDMSEAKFKRSYSCPPRKQSAMACHPIICLHEAMFIAGRYNKFSRRLPQTPWVVDGERRIETSVQELICDNLKSHVRAEDYKFSTSGREDIDVKCLGNGRPFLIEFVNPHQVTLKAEELKELQAAINKSSDMIAVKHLQVVSREETQSLKEGEEEKTKTYSALCWSDTPVTQEYLSKILSPLKDLTLQQKTPVRVLHRRSLAVREKVIHSCTAKLIDEHHFDLFLKTQAGTYIKEFVHGDFGRTTPSLGSLLERECDILELNVESVDLDWPPPVEYD